MKMVVLQPSEAGEDDLPVVVVGHLASGHSAEEHQLACAGVIHVGGNIHETLPQPPEPHRRGKAVAFHEEGYCYRRRDDPVSRCSSQHLDESSKR